jgi:NNP family nitrate/nitrite transporter-like MFS transporter
MLPSERRLALQALIASTLAFTTCFAAWVMYGVLVTSLMDARVVTLDAAQLGWLIGLPALTGALARLPVGVFTARLGGRPVFAALMLLTACGAVAVSFADDFWGLAGAGLLLGFSGASFTAGSALIEVWFPRHRRAVALSAFSAGGVGAAVSAVVAPALLRAVTDGGAHLDGWRALPRLYAAALIVVAGLFYILSTNRTPSTASPPPLTQQLSQQLACLRRVSVWRFGLYDLFTFGSFVTLAQWLIPYYMNVYGVTLASAGLLSVLFTLPSTLARAVGGGLLDRFGARVVMSGALGVPAVCAALLLIPKALIEAPRGEVLARSAGTVAAVSAGEVVIGAEHYPLIAAPDADKGLPARDDDAFFFPRMRAWEEPVVMVGEVVAQRQRVARGVTQIYFQANIGVFTALVALLGVAIGIGAAVIDRKVPAYFPGEVSAVGGLVSAFGALGGFILPVVFGYLLLLSGLWTSAWSVIFLLAAACAAWMRRVIQRMNAQHAPTIQHQIDHTIPVETFTVCAYAARATAPPAAPQRL